jgi:(S)-ureidoglycine---glyoxylate transaminase
VTVIEREWGTAFDPEEIIRAIRRHRPKVVALVHGETSTGRLQPLDGIGAACREYDALLVVDAVATIGGVPVNTDDWQLDAVVGGTQKCLSVPSGMAPLTYNARVERLLAGRRRIERGLRSAGEGTSARPYIRSNYLDLCQLQDYWGPERLNHHTEMTAMLYGLYEGVRIVLEEGLEARFRRHRMHERALTAGLAAMGLRLFGDPSCKLPVVTCVNIPEGIDGESVRSMLLDAFGIEIAGSFGPLKGRIWRIGTMGYSCNMRNVLLTLGALEAALLRHGMRVPAGQAVQAAMDVYAEEQAVQTG